ncbi:MAG: VacB/RNase II family 3'-5' exoribonuclease [Sphingobium sp.]|jgi:ribonuclease R|nr:VacB/RNase II family 3'-5' exoribonuclease [Sphingobium sp.]MCI1272448.1 VacB/RNase II family 3'-5' exoribonuclease [Sphingobium sp.]MCI1755931.1 VacB/RNase II family 3'-5' exoribonuclease [Sphingobium sp.]MCI2052298.1 VacB/RNase II family 3'-5' exoribonuclease [Sphingobium sp.]
MARNTRPGMPTRQQILEFIESSSSAVGKREIAKAFGLHAQDKILLKGLLKDMADEGLIDIGPGRAFHKMGGVPRVTVLRVVEVDGGQAIAVPERWEAEGIPPPKLRVIERGKKHGALGIGDRFLARTEDAGKGLVAHPMKKLSKAEEQLLGVVEKGENDRFWLKPVDKRIRHATLIADLGGASVGDLVLCEASGRPPKVTARVAMVLGDPFAPKSFSLIAIHKYGIPHVFSDSVEGEANAVSALPLHADKREDLRHLPIVAIDPVDARDFDDAVWAASDDDPANAGGFRAIVAIADVSYYVRPGSALDREARKRGNSVYFPDLVVPMLPHALSSDMCSLRAGQDRAAMACHMTFDAKGVMKSWRFSRAIIRVAANIPYEDAQAAIDGTRPHDLTEAALRPLWACWAVLAKARHKRAPLELDLPERRVVLDEAGRIMSVAVRERLDAHMLIEDYMIAANVAAAKALESRKAPVMYRVHEPPSREKLVALKEYLATYDIGFALGQVITPTIFNRLIERLVDHEARPIIMEQILRSQTQAYYSPQNAGHFGLALGSYAHFTSPIRRYSDLLVHRSLVGAFDLEMPAPKGDSLPPVTALSQEDYNHMARVGDLISQCERRAMEAERETVDRYVAAYLSEHVGEVMKTRITGVQSFGFFASVDGLGGDGLVPVSMLGVERFHFDETHRALIGEQTGTRFHVGQEIDLRLAEADPVGGSLRFELPDGPEFSLRGNGRGRGGAGKPPRPIHRRGRPANIRHTSSKRGPVKRR